MQRSVAEAQVHDRLKKWVRAGGKRPMARAAYSGVVSAEIALAGALARRNAIAPLDPGNLTVLVKTFERPGVLARMLRSIRQVFTGPILVADDSQRPQTDLGDPMTKVITLPFDSGIGAGRNALLAAAETEFVLMADDDMVVLPDFDVRRMVSYLQRNPEVDLVGGRVINLPALAYGQLRQRGPFRLPRAASLTARDHHRWSSGDLQVAELLCGAYTLHPIHRI